MARDVQRGEGPLQRSARLAELPSRAPDLASVQREIVEEVAYTMGRSARRLEEALGRLDELGQALDALCEGSPGREQALLEYEEQRRYTIERIHFLKIQREALGFLKHDEVDRHYPVPERRR